MAVSDLPTREQLRKLLNYDAGTGTLTWKRRSPDMFAEGRHSAARICGRWNTTYAGKTALSTLSHGYKVGTLLGCDVLAHRVIWAWVHGEWPEQIDHINGDRADNRLANLRAVTLAENGRNTKLHKRNTSGVCGVTLLNGKWWARITFNGVSETLGYFEEFADAVTARKDAERRYGFHPNHGRRQNAA